jgi:hypothetical protein
LQLSAGITPFLLTIDFAWIRRLLSQLLHEHIQQEVDLNKHHPNRKGRRYLRKRQVAARYNVDERTIDRMAKDGRLPAYIYLPGSKLPLQDEDELDARDDAAAAARDRQAMTA